MAEFDARRLIDMLYDLVNDAKNFPLSGDKCVIDRETALDLIEELRDGLPAELERAQDLIRGREEYVNKAKQEVDKMIQRADAEAKSKVADSELVLAARSRAGEIIRRAEDRSSEMYRVVNEYTEDALRRTEEAIQAALEEVKQSRVKFRAASAARRQKDRDELSRSAKKSAEDNG